MARPPAGKKPAPKKATPAKKPATAKKVAGKGVLVAIYELSHPVTLEVRYVGKANNPAARLKSHMRDARRRETPLYCWIRRLRAEGLVPAIRVVKWVEDWKEAEKRHIAAHRASGARLLNLADGGDEPHCSTEQRAKNGALVARTRNKTIWATRQRIGQLRRYFEQSKNEQYAEMMMAAQVLFDLLPPHKQVDYGLRIGVGA